jgi:peptidase S41-like protein
MRPALLLLAAVSTLALAAPAAASAQSAQPAAAAMAHPAAVAPRAVVGRIAARIEERYFDPARGKALANELRAAAAKGEFDQATDPRDLAVVLTDRLKSRDAHFSVSWAPVAAEPPSAGPRGPEPTEAEQRAEQDLIERRFNYGFRSVGVLPGAIGYIDMSAFADFDGRARPDAPARRAADAAVQLVSGADAVIIDLRDNGGGSPAMVGYLASYFLPKGADVYNTFKSRGPDESEAPQVEVTGQRRLDVPLYILVSARTGSAAEAFAYTLQAARRASIVGEASAGAANPGGAGPVGDGFSIFISDGRPVNPITRTNWEGTGVTPDVEVAPAAALRKAQMLALTQIAKAPPQGAAGVENRWAMQALLAEDGPPPSAAELAPYAGAYGTRQLTIEDGRLMMKAGRRPAVALQRIAPDVFSVAGAPGRRFQFERDGGRVTALVSIAPDGSEARLAKTSPAA